MAKFIQIYEGACLLNLDHIKEIHDMVDQGVQIVWSRTNGDYPTRYTRASFNDIRQQLEALGAINPVP